jgi:hypothetical protein
MHKGLWAVIAAAVLLWVASWSYGEPALPEVRPRAGHSAGGLLTHHLPGVAGDHLVVIDPAVPVMAVYRVHKEHGEIKLESVRRIDSDLRLLSFNTEAPLPEEIRAGLERQARY